jgi:uroporphyrinogen decarboxylase
MDFVKIQYEQHYTPLDWLRTPADWSKLEVRGKDFYEPVFVAVRELVKNLKREAMIVMTLYSPFMWAGHVATLPRLLKHMKQDPEAVKKGLTVLTESQMIFVKECIRLGVDGFYMSTQGAESGQFDDPRLFEQYVKPSDLVAMHEAMAKCPLNILHVCDYNAPYASYEAVADYPGHLVNCSPELVGREMSWPALAALFKRPMFGGLAKRGVLSTGTQAEVESATLDLLTKAPARFMLGSECTVPGKTPWDNLRAAVRTAHQFKKG